MSPSPSPLPVTGGVGRVARAAKRLVLLAVALLVVTADPAAADPPGPTSWVSEVSPSQPDGTTVLPDGVTVRVLGGDSFLHLQNTGREVVVPGYGEDEDYLRFEPDGTVLVNQRSRTHWLNQDRYGAVAVPDDVGGDVPPQWVRVASDGAYAWHDHRIHWMSPETLPAEVDPSRDQPQTAYEWQLPLRVDGQGVVVTGRLTWLPPVTPWVAPVAAAGLLGAALVVGRRSRARAMAATLGVAGLAAVVLGAAMVVALPTGVAADPLPLVLGLVAVVVGAAGLFVRERTFGLAVAGLAGVPLVVWAIMRAGAATAAVVPPLAVPAVVSRIALGLAAGGGVALLGLGLWDLFRRPVGAVEE